MCDCHITRQLRQARDVGRLPEKGYIELLEEHNHALCETCRREYELHTGSRSATEEALARNRADTGSTDSTYAEEWRTATEDLETLLEHPPPARRAAVERARQRFRSPFLAEQLIARSYECLPLDPQGSLEFAELALAVSEKSSRPGKAEQRVLALVHRGNALRALGRLVEAGNCFRQARRLVRSGIRRGDYLETITSLDIYAKLSWWEGVYNRELGKWSHAEGLLNRAVVYFTLDGNQDALHRVVLSLAALYRCEGNARAALEAVTGVLGRLSERDDPGLYWIARLNYVCYLVDAEYHETAQHELRRCLTAPGFPRDEFQKRRVQWLQGRIERELGDLEGAERRLVAVRKHFLAEENGFNMALVSLDLARVYLAQGRSGDLKRIAEELTPIFESMIFTAK